MEELGKEQGVASRKKKGKMIGINISVEDA